MHKRKHTHIHTIKPCVLNGQLSRIHVKSAVLTATDGDAKRNYCVSELGIRLRTVKIGQGRSCFTYRRRRGGADRRPARGSVSDRRRGRRILATPVFFPAPLFFGRLFFFFFAFRCFRVSVFSRFFTRPPLFIIIRDDHTAFVDGRINTDNRPSKTLATPAARGRSVSYRVCGVSATHLVLRPSF